MAVNQALTLGKFSILNSILKCRGICKSAIVNSAINRMQAWQIHEYGGNEELTLSKTTRVYTLQNPCDVLVQVHAASVNPIDINIRAGYAKKVLNILRGISSIPPGCPSSPFPLILGRDFSGTVVQTGKAVKKFEPGDEVWGALGIQRQGTHAEYVLAAADTISKKPQSISHVEAASLPFVALTTWSALCIAGQLTENNCVGKRIFINGGSGGLGTFAIQLMKAWGAEVTTTCSTDAVDLLNSLGADCIIDYKTQDVKQELQERAGFDVILDTLREDTDLLLSILKKWRNAKLVSVNRPYLKNLSDWGFVLGSGKAAVDLGIDVIKGLKDGRFYRWAVFAPNGNFLKKVAQLVDDKQIQVVIDQVFSFEEVPTAYEKVEKGHARGKTVISVKEPLKEQQKTPPDSETMQSTSESL